MSNFQKGWSCLVKQSWGRRQLEKPFGSSLQVYKFHFYCHMRRNGGCWLPQLNAISRVINSSDQGMPFSTLFFICASFYASVFGWKCKWLSIWYQTLQTSEGQIAWKSFLSLGLFNPILWDSPKIIQKAVIFVDEIVKGTLVKQQKDKFLTVGFVVKLSWFCSN